jgi:nuclear cap-binding protein subunit 1
VAATAKAHVKWEAAVEALKAAKTDEARSPASAKVDWAKTVADKAQDEETSTQDSLEAKEALLARALREQEALFLAVYQSFADLLNERLAKPLPEESQAPEQADGSERDADGPSAMEEVEEDTTPMESESVPQKGGDVTNGTDLFTTAQEEMQWRKCTLGYLRAISREYSNEVWLLIERLDATIFTKTVHPLVLSATNAGLQRLP